MTTKMYQNTSREKLNILIPTFGCWSRKFSVFTYLFMLHLAIGSNRINIIKDPLFGTYEKCQPNATWESVTFLFQNIWIYIESRFTFSYSYCSQSSEWETLAEYSLESWDCLFLLNPIVISGTREGGGGTCCLLRNFTPFPCT